MTKEQSPLFYGILEIHGGLLLLILAVIMFVNPSFVFNGNLLLDVCLAGVFIAVVSAFLVSGYNKAMLGRAQLKTLGKAKYVILALNIVGLIILGIGLLLIPSKHYIYGSLDSNTLILGIFFAFELIAGQYYRKKLPSYKPELI
jgi:hypothetical protein